MSAQTGEVQTICEAFARSVRAGGDRIALRGLTGEPSLTWSEYGEQVGVLAAGLASLGVGRGDTVALLLSNRMECHLLDMAALHLGAVPFSIYQTSSPEQIEEMLGNAESRVLITETAYAPAALQSRRLGCWLEHVIVVDGAHPGADLTMSELIGAGRGTDVGDAWRDVTPDDVATIVYTSGTTGPRKGVQWSHRGVLASARRLGAAIPLATEMQVSYLPMAHAGCRMVVYYTSIINGSATTFCPDYRQLSRYIADARPDNTMLSVPRIYEKLKITIETRISELDSAERVRVEDAIQIGIDRTRQVQSGQRFEMGPDRAAVYRSGADLIGQRVLRPLGLDRMRFAVMGGAPAPMDVIEFFHGIGIPLVDAYGLTECGTFATFNRPDDFRLGTAGKPLPETEIRLDHDGEILIRCESNMVGYRKQPDATREALDPDGWLRTGDIGRFDAEGYLTIIDRKKELIINSAGKNMSPASIERAIKLASPLIAQVVAIGDGRNYNVALITLEPERTADLCVELGLPSDRPTEQIARDDRVFERINAAVQCGNRRLSRVEQIKRFAVVGFAWTPDSDELTPTSKVKRRVIHDKYRHVIDGLYSAPRESSHI